MAVDKSAPKAAVPSKGSPKPEDVPQTKEPKGFFASYKMEIIIGGFTVVTLSLLLYVVFLFISMYFEMVDEVKILNRKLEGAVMLACKVNYRKYPTQVTFKKAKNSEGNSVTVLVCEPEPQKEEE